MKKLTKTTARLIIGVLDKNKSKKYVPIDFVSRKIGIYPDVLAEELSEIEPTAMLDSELDIKPLYEALVEFSKTEPRKEKTRVSVTKKELSQYSGVSDFIYKHMTSAGGLFDRNAKLSDQDLAVLKKLINTEITGRNKKGKKHVR